MYRLRSVSKKTLYGLFTLAFLLASVAVFGNTTALATEKSIGSLATNASIQTDEKAQIPTMDVYRLYNGTNGEHLYTTDAHEVNVLVKTYGWQYEGIGWTSPEQGDPVYRLYNPSLRNHLYTTDTNEVRVLTSAHGWQKDNNGNPLFYSGSSIQIYRVYNRELSGMHHLTTDSNEYKTLPRYGWQQEGVKLYCDKPGNPNAAMPADPNAATIENTNSKTTIEADVTLSGSGTGHHAKLVICTATAAVSFGLQYDQNAQAPYTGKTMLMIENVMHNGAGGQQYLRPGNYVANKNTTYHLMMTLNNDGTGNVYLNGTHLGSFNNPSLKNQYVYLRVEGAARKNNDSVTAKFANIKLKNNGTYYPDKVWETHQFTSNPTVQVTKASGSEVVISGTISGWPPNVDWDTAGYYDKASGIIQFVE